MINPTHQLDPGPPALWSGPALASSPVRYPFATFTSRSCSEELSDAAVSPSQSHRQKTVALLVVCSFPSLNTEEAHAFLLTLAECATQKHFIPAAAVITSPRLGGGFAVEPSITSETLGQPKVSAERH